MNPRETALMINEISPHLPVYLWGPAVGRILEAAQRGFMLMATAHADSIHDLVRALTGSPLHIRAAQVAALEFVAVLERDEEKQSGRRVRELWRLEPIRDGVAIAPLHSSEDEASDISQEISTTQVDTAVWFPKRELAHRQRILEDLRDQRIGHLPPGSLFADTGFGDLDP